MKIWIVSILLILSSYSFSQIKITDVGDGWKGKVEQALDTIQKYDKEKYYLIMETCKVVAFWNGGFSTTESDRREMVFAPGVNGLANNSVSYTSGTTSYKSFRTFAIKVVMVGNDPVDVPVISDFRSIAYPAA